ncbi:putative holin [Limnobaculum xujianqingii]|uniref:putative holin n=1 Tax=Limnobaculum xujianqingii TaxID=2738837 RepID=UPI00112B5A44|nr:putative holin [Limnobaculum xujianqingii]
MADPIGTSTTATASVLTGATLAGLLSGIDPGVIIAAFAGSVIFVLSAIDFPLWQRAFLFFVSMALGIYGADFVAHIISTILSVPLRSQITVSAPVGAAVSSASSVRILMVFSKKPNEGESIWDRFRFKKSSKGEDEQ